MKRMSYYIIGLLLSLMSWSCSDDAETGREEIPVETDGGYLFAHMTNANYGKLYYAVSRDGINWETLNKGRIINSAYIGHPDICQSKAATPHAEALDWIIQEMEDCIDMVDDKEYDSQCLANQRE